MGWGLGAGGLGAGARGLGLASSCPTCTGYDPPASLPLGPQPMSEVARETLALEELGKRLHCRLAVCACRNERCVVQRKVRCATFTSASWALVLNSGSSEKVPERNLDLLKESTAQGDRT